MNLYKYLQTQPVNVTQFAQALGVARPTVYKWLRTGVPQAQRQKVVDASQGKITKRALAMEAAKLRRADD